MKKYLLLITFLLLLFLISLIPYEEEKSVFGEHKLKLVALTFDDGPHYKYTNELLDFFYFKKINVTFFVLGKNIKENSDTIKRMNEDGHQIENHTFSHANLYSLEKDQIEDEISKTNQLIFDTIGKYPKYLRPSYGNYNELVKDSTNLKIVTWTLDSHDWQYRNKKRIVKNLKNNIKEGDIILLHDIYPSTVKAVKEIVNELEKDNYLFVTLNEIFMAYGEEKYIH